MRVVRVFVIALLVAGVANAQKQKLKVYISADMEGIGGVITDVQADPKGHEYEKFRRLMTEEVNAAIAGAYDAGATEVLVNDGHGDSQNIDPGTYEALCLFGLHHHRGVKSDSLLYGDRLNRAN